MPEPIVNGEATSLLARTRSETASCGSSCAGTGVAEPHRRVVVKRPNARRKTKSAASAGKALAERIVVEQAFDASGQTAGACHGDSYRDSAPLSREFKQDLSVGRAARSFFHCRPVADGLGQLGEFMLEPPAKRARPDECGVEAGE